MSTQTLTCAKCGGQMQDGYIRDESYARVLRSSWFSGKYTPSFWTGHKTKGKKQAPITAFRCRACGYLEMYALKRN